MTSSLSRLYYTYQNDVLDNFSTSLAVLQSMAYAIKAFPIGQKTAGTTGTSGAPPSSALWTVVGSSDGSTAGMDNVDRTGSTFNAAKWIRAASGSAHSWIVIKSPTGITSLGVAFYRLISLGTSADNRLLITDAKAPFTGGSITADPTSIDSWPYTSELLNDVVATIHNCGYVTDANGGHYVHFSRPGIGYFHTFIAFLPFLNPQTGDQYPVCSVLDDRASLRGALDFNGAVLSASGFGGFEGVNSRSATGSSLPSSGAGSGIKRPDDGWMGKTNTNESSGKHDTLACNYFFYQTSGNIGGMRGSLPDWWLANSAKPVGQCEPSTGATEHMLVGNIYVPNGGVVPAM